MRILKNSLQKKLEETNFAPVIQEKNINTVMDLYKKIIINDKNNNIAIAI